MERGANSLLNLDTTLAGGAHVSSMAFMSLGALSSLMVSIFGLRAFLSSEYAHGANKYPSPGFTPMEVIGLIAWMVFAPCCTILVLIITMNLLKHSSLLQSLKLSWLTFLLAMCVAGVLVCASSAREILQCGIFFCESERRGAEHDPTGIFDSLGLWGLVVFAVLVVTLAMMISAFLRPRSLRDWPVLTSRTTQRRRCRSFASVCLAVLFNPVCLFLTSLLPNTFSGFQLFGRNSNLLSYMEMEATDAETKQAWMRTQNIRLSRFVVLKLYPDILLFYGFLEVLAVACIFTTFWPGVKARFAKRGVGHLSVGESSVLGLFGVMLGLWFFYWLHEHSYEGGTFHSRDGKMARVFGITAVLFMSVTLLPAAKNSLWLEAIGISWEKSLWVHRCAGRMCLALIICHVVGFWIRWGDLHIFPHDILAIPTYYPMNGPKPKTANSDDWTIPMMEIIGYPALLALGLPWLWRRRNWEIFKYLHFVFLALIPATLLHATSGWYYLLGGVGFWLIDVAIRFASTARPTTMLSMIAHDAEGGVTELRFDKFFKEPGQYCFVNVPALSTFEWHPFSLSSSPLDGFASMCIKNMGPGTFTGRLHELAGHRGENSPLVINVDGPYGPSLDSLDYSAIFLISGGIGITPMHSIFRTLSQLAARQELPTSLQLIRLVWIGRSMALFRILLDSLAECVQPGRFEIALYLSSIAEQGYHSREGPSPEAQGVPLFAGRPSFDTLYDALEHDCQADGPILVKACGPEAMVSASQAAAARRTRFVYESELFIL